MFPLRRWLSARIKIHSCSPSLSLPFPPLSLSATFSPPFITRSFLFIYVLIFRSLQSFCSGSYAVSGILIDYFVRPKDSRGSLCSVNKCTQVWSNSSFAVSYIDLHNIILKTANSCGRLKRQIESSWFVLVVTVVKILSVVVRKQGGLHFALKSMVVQTAWQVSQNAL